MWKLGMKHIADLKYWKNVFIHCDKFDTMLKSIKM